MVLEKARWAGLKGCGGNGMGEENEHQSGKGPDYTCMCCVNGLTNY